MISARSEGRGRSYGGISDHRRCLQQLNENRCGGPLVPCPPDKLLTDRTAYVGYLESQLERVSASCLTVQSYDQRLQDAYDVVHKLEQKVSSSILLHECFIRIYWV